MARMFLGDDGEIVLGDEMQGYPGMQMGTEDYDPSLASLAEILGAEILGGPAKAALRAPAIPAQLRLLQQVISARQAGGKVLANQAPANERRQGAAFPATLVAAGATAVIQMQPQRYIRVDKLFVPSIVAGFFTAQSLTVMAEEQFAAPGSPMPCQAFTEVSTGGFDLKGKTCQPSGIILITVTNIDAAPQTFRGGIFGPVVM